MAERELRISEIKNGFARGFITPEDGQWLLSELERLEKDNSLWDGKVEQMAQWIFQLKESQLKYRTALIEIDKYEMMGANWLATFENLKRIARKALELVK